MALVKDLDKVLNTIKGNVSRMSSILCVNEAVLIAFLSVCG